MRHTLTILPLLALAAAALAQEAPADPVQRRTLDNGLEVLVRPVEGARHVAVLVRFDFGERSDAEGRSGFAHLMEHLYVTCAAGETPARTAAEWFAANRFGANAQTMEDATVVAEVVPPERVDAALVDAAARMSDLRITRADLDRELPRVEAELRNMYGAMPQLASANLARGRLLPAAIPGARKGGVFAQVEDVTVEECVAAWTSRYRTRNARLVVVGAVDADAVLVRAAELFGEITAGEPPPEPAPRPPPAADVFGKVEVVAARAWARNESAHVCVAWPAPRPGDDDFPAFLALVTRLWLSSSARPARPGDIQPAYTALEDPRALLVRSTVRPGEEPEAAAQRVEAAVRDLAERSFAKREGAMARVQNGVLLGTYRAPEMALATNPYGLALRLAVWDGHIDPLAIGDAMQALDEETFRAVMDALLPRRTAVVVRPAPAEGE